MRREYLLATLITFATVSSWRQMSAQSGLSATLAESMWAAQTEPRTIRLAWYHVPGATRYSASCQDERGGFRRIATMPAPKLLRGHVKDAADPPIRMSTLVTSVRLGAALRCFLQWSGEDAKGTGAKATGVKGTEVGETLSERIPFNVVTPIEVNAPVTTEAGPSAVDARASGAVEITVEWTAVPGATAYLVERSVQPEGFRPYCDLCSTKTKLVDHFVKVGATHQYAIVPLAPGRRFRSVSSNKVVAVGSAHELAALGDPTVDPSLKPPSSVRAAISGPATVTVTWDGVPGAAGYQVFRAASKGALQLVGRVPAGTSREAIHFDDYLGSFLGAGSSAVTVSYAVKSIDAKDAVTAPETSNEVTIDPKAALTTGASSLDATNLRAVVESANAINLTWTPPAVGIVCSITRSLSGGLYAAVRPISTGTTQYRDEAPSLLAHAPQYSIQCGKAKAQRFPIPTTSAIQFGDRTGASTSETAPANLRATFTSPTSVTLTWGPPTQPITCSLLRSDNLKAYALIQKFELGTWQYTDSAPGLGEVRPRYELACGGLKSAAPVAFPTPRPVSKP